MREFDALSGYPEPKQPRVVSSNLRTIQHRIVASYRDQEFYDGDRDYGYGGFNYDGRWLPIAQNMCKEYGLTNQNLLFYKLVVIKAFSYMIFNKLNQESRSGVLIFQSMPLSMHLKLSQERCIVIENSPLGIQAAKAANTYCIAICSTLDAPSLKGADRIIEKF